MAKSNQSVFPQAVDIIGQIKDPVRSLWRCVLLVALEDALGKHWRNKDYGHSHNHWRVAARDYFLHPNGDFKMVCTLAGYDHEYVRMKAKQLFRKDKNDEVVTRVG